MKRALLLTYLLIAFLGAQAQTKLVFEETTPEAYLIKYNPTGNSSQQSINNILNLLSDGNTASPRGGRPNRKPEYVVRFEQHARIADAGDVLQLKVQLQKAQVSGDVIYRGFDMGEVLLPEKVSAKVKLLNAQNKEVQVYTLPGVALDKAGTVLHEVTMPDTAASQSYKLQVVEKELIYTAENVKRVQERQELIRAYYAAETKINGALQDVMRVQPDDIDRLTFHDRNLRLLEDLHGQIKDAPFREKLNLKQHDPQGLNAKLSNLYRLMEDRRRAITHAFATLDEQFYNRGISLLTRGNAKGAQEYFIRSVEVNPRFAPSLLQLARLDFTHGYLKEAEGRTREILTQMRVDPQTEQLALALAHDIYGVYINDGNNLTSRGEYGNALAAYANARNLCSTIGGMHCNLPALRDGEARAAYGEYRSITAEGKRLLAQNDLKKAEQLAEEALQFQREYQDVLRGATDAQELHSQVKFQFYVQFIDSGKRYLSEKNYSTALSQFEAALDMEGKYGFQPVRELGALAQKAAKPVLLAQLTDGYQQAMNNRLTDARATASSATALRSRYALEQDKEVQTKYDLLRERIFTQECRNQQAEYNRHLQNAKSLVREEKYLAADQAFLAAIKAANDKTACGIAAFTAIDGREVIAMAVTYLRMLEDADRFVAGSRYEEAIQKYNEAESFYLQQEVNKFGLDHISLFNYAKDNQKKPFTAAVVNHFASIEQEEVAILLLTALLEQDYPKRKTKKVQQQIGLQLAARDMRGGQLENAELQAAKYTKGNRNLKHLGKAYEKEWKRLKKN
ncbi:hypothetical protein [Pontibacter ruber]|uniref:Tetratricopeptide repeat protein n=1 Tax=Pontibacter ruber TaxID=1343895 RepID=A0ABW5CY07_9BACT|nr:hypothetical protein [Pontibacter ruber]